MSRSVGCVLLSQGNRPDELSRAIGTVLAQQDVDVSVVVVGNGWEPAGLPPEVITVALTENVGVPEGRNIGADAAAGDLLFFLDDDIEVVGADFLARAADQFAADDHLFVVQPRAVDPDGSPTARRHVPRLRAADAGRSGDVAWFWEGASSSAALRSQRPEGGRVRSSTATRESSSPGVSWMPAAGSVTTRSWWCTTRPLRRFGVRGTGSWMPATEYGLRVATSRFTGRGLPRGLGHGDADPVGARWRDRGRASRVPRRVAHRLRTATPDPLAHGLAADPVGTTADRLT